LYELAQGNEAIHIFDHLTYIGAGLIGWWPILGAEMSRIPKPEPPVRMLYLFLLTLPCTALSALLTFAHAPFYPFYATTPHPFGIDALLDQQLGGLIMWLPTHMVLLAAIGITFLKWFAGSDRMTVKEIVPPDAPGAESQFVLDINN
jgi:cytochrome c oxidase assembly factor CtaG